MFVREAVERGAIHPETFVRRLRIDTNGEGLHFGQACNRQGLDDLSFNLMFGTLAVSVIQIDTALDQAFGATTKRPEPPDELGAARSIVCMLRCAFAHNPLVPIWEVRNPYYRRLFDVPSIHVAVDFSGLNGQTLVPNQFGGWEGFTRLALFCRDAANSVAKPKEAGDSSTAAT